VHPISQPNCWAYADMLMVGVESNPWAPTVGAAASVIEWRSHFGAWAIVSSPLILSFDLTNSTTMSAVWPFITNLEAIGINQAWAGHPGRRLTANASMQVWTKPVGPTRFAVLAINMEAAVPGRGSPVAITIDLAAVSPKLAAGSKVTVRDVWQHTDLSTISSHLYTTESLQPHDSAFLLFEIAS